MSDYKSTSGQHSSGLGSAEVDDVLEALRPRMRTARIRHVRFMGAIIALVPLMGLGAMALGQSGGDPGVSVASGGLAERQVDEPDDGVGTEIGEADGDEQALPEPEAESDGVEEAESTEEDGPAPDDAAHLAPENFVHEVEMATFGVAKIKVSDDGVELIEAIISEPWEFVGAEINDHGDLVISVTNGDAIKLITIGEGLWDEFHVKFDDFVPPTTTTAKPEPRPEPEPEPQPVVDRIVLEVSPAGSFVVEREGEVLWAGNVQPNEGFDYDIIKAEGWKVWVAFVDETHVYHGKAYINDHGVLKTETWTEVREIPVEPVYQWVEIPGVGAVKFKLYDGLMYVQQITPFEGFGSYVYNEVGESVKVDFEGEGQLWIVEAWSVEGEIQWAIAGPNP